MMFKLYYAFITLFSSIIKPIYLQSYFSRYKFIQHKNKKRCLIFRLDNPEKECSLNQRLKLVLERIECLLQLV